MAGLIERCIEVYYDPENRQRQNRHTHWVMSRSWYDRLRAEGCTEEQERARASAHAGVWISVTTEWPSMCPVCTAGPFGTIRELSEHVIAMADPAYRKPDDHDQVLGLPVRVRDDGGEPHLEHDMPGKQ